MNWSEEDNFLKATFKFKDFKEALVFVNKVGELAERLNHHPDISIKDYNTVIIATTSHDGGMKVTQKDHDLARAIDAVI